MLSNKVQSALNAQINAEFWSAYLYLSMACHFDAEGKPGIANWFRIQFQEEQAHAQIFMNYVNARAGRVELKPIDAVPTQWESPIAAFENTLEHERKVTAMINNLAAIAKADNDFASVNRLVWFIDEQIEEEETARNLIQATEAVEDNKYGMYMLDKELATRTYNTPSPLASAE